MSFIARAASWHFINMPQSPHHPTTVITSETPDGLDLGLAVQTWKKLAISELRLEMLSDLVTLDVGLNDIEEIVRGRKEPLIEAGIHEIRDIVNKLEEVLIGEVFYITSFRQPDWCLQYHQLSAARLVSSISPAFGSPIGV